MDKQGAQKEKSSKQRTHPVKEGDRTCTWFGVAEAEHEGSQRQGVHSRKALGGPLGPHPGAWALPAGIADTEGSYAGD